LTLVLEFLKTFR